jgi:predicted extracellular nuclease
VLVNHLKSKGSACAGDPDTGDGSGNCNQTRTNAAEAIVDWLATDPTGSGDADFLIIGDLNSYTFETPIQALEAGGFENLIRTFNGLTAYSYVFNGESGYLDHALGSASLSGQVSGVTEWHINPDEPTVLDYNLNFKSANHQTTLYDPGAYRSSDHDPVIVGLQLDLTYDGLCTLTREYVDRDGIADSMCARLEAAERAEAEGYTLQKERALRVYVRLVEEAERQGRLTAAEAAHLIALAEAL